VPLRTPPAPDPRRAADTRARIVEAARFLFWENGYTATGLAELLARADANSGSFYYFFESKDALLRTVLETYVDLLEPRVLRAVWTTHAGPLDRIFGLLDGYRQRLVDTGCTYGCPIGRLALELDAENAPAHALIARNFSAWIGAVETCVRAAGIARPRDVATFVLTVMEGGVMQSRACRSIAPFDTCVRQLRLHLGALAARPPRRSLTSRAPGRSPRS
jgi:AcrR family transcriptional regulator